MQKHFYVVILFSTFFCHNCFSQAYPPTLKSYADSVGIGYDTLFISFSPNDTGVIKAEVWLQQGIGNIVYDSIYTLPAGDTSNVALQMMQLSTCKEYDVLFSISNDAAEGLQSNPLYSFTTLCGAGIASLNANNYSVIAYEQSVEVKTDEVPQNGTVEIYDVTGRLILATSLHQSVQQIPFNKNAGIYLLRITGNGQSLYTNRFMIY